MNKMPSLLCVFALLLFMSCGSKTETKSVAKTASDSTALKKGMSTVSVNKDQLVKAYSLAIGQYIKAMNEKDGSVFDTLFIGKHADFPDIVLPATINKTPVLLLVYEEAEKKLVYRKSLVYLNVFGWITKTRAEFIIVTFFEGAKPQHNCLINYQYNNQQNKFELESLTFKYQYAVPDPKLKKLIDDN